MIGHEVSSVRLHGVIRASDFDHRRECSGLCPRGIPGRLHGSTRRRRCAPWISRHLHASNAVLICVPLGRAAKPGRSELTAMVSFYFLFLTLVAAVIIGLFNFSRSDRVHQDPSPGLERSVTATKRVPRLFMVAPKIKHGWPATKAANSASVSTERADAKKSKHHKLRGSNGGY